MRAIVILAAIFLSGCVSTYQAPRESAPAATLLISADEASVTGPLKADFLSVQLFSDEKCSTHPSGTNLAHFAGLARKDDFEGSAKRIEAGHPVAISFLHFAGLYGSNQCKLTYSFVPQSNMIYSAHFTRQSGQCNVSLTLESGSPIPDLKRITPGCSR